MELTITGDKDEVAQSLLNPARVVATKGSNDAVKNIRIKKEADGTQYAEATNLDMSVRSHLWAQIDADEADVLISPKLRQAVAAMPTGVVNVEIKGGLAKVTGTGKSRYEIPMAGGEFPKIPWPNHDWGSVKSAEAADLMKLMQAAAKFAWRSENKPALRGVNLKQVDGEIVVSGTDTFRLFQARMPAIEVFEEETTLPLSMVGELAALFPSGKIKAIVDKNALFVGSDNGETTFMCRKIGHPYPNVDRLTPESFDHQATFKREDMNDSLDRAAIMSKKGAPIALTLKGDEAEIRLRSEIGTGYEYCPMTIELKEGTDEFAIGFNFEHFVSAIGNFKAAELIAKFTTPTRPMQLSADGEKLTILVIPVRVA